MGQKEEAWARWRGLISEQSESGKSIAGFCRDRELPVCQFYEWKKRLRQADTGNFVAVVAAEPLQVSVTSIPEQSVPIEIRLSRGRSVLVGPGFDANHLRRLLSVLDGEA